MPKAMPKISAIDSQPRAMPWAPRAASPSRLTTDRKTICPATIDRLSAAAGRLIRNSRRSSGGLGRSSERRSFRPARPRLSSTSRATVPRAWLSPAPQAMPASPSPGQSPRPRKPAQASGRFASVVPRPIHSGVRVSPAPARLALPVLLMSWKGSRSIITPRKSVAYRAAVPSRFSAPSSVAIPKPPKTQPAMPTPIDRSSA